MLETSIDKLTEALAAHTAALIMVHGLAGMDNTAPAPKPANKPGPKPGTKPAPKQTDMFEDDFEEDVPAYKQKQKPVAEESDDFDDDDFESTPAPAPKPANKPGPKPGTKPGPKPAAVTPAQATRPGASMDDIRKIASKLAKLDVRDKLMAILADHDADRLANLDPSQYNIVYRKMERLAAESSEE